MVCSVLKSSNPCLLYFHTHWGGRKLKWNLQNKPATVFKATSAYKNKKAGSISSVFI